MLSERIIKTIGWRVKAMVYGGETIYDWDNNTRRFVYPSPYLYWNWCLGLIGGFGFCIIHAVNIYLKINGNKHDLKDEAEHVNSSSETLAEFASLVVEWGELIVVLVICLVALQLFRLRDEVMYLYNQMITYHFQLQGIIKSKDIGMDDHHKKVIHMGELHLLLLGIGSIFFTLVLLACLFHPLEPNHILILEWFEFEVTIANLKPIHYALAPILIAALTTAGNTVITGAYLVTIYYLMATLSLADITPVNFYPDKKLGLRKFTILETSFLGNMDDTEVINLYRTQQLFLVILNKFMASILISLQHVATLGCAAIMIYFAIKFNGILSETGIIGYFVIWGSITVPFALEFFEADFLGKLVGISEGFVESGKNIMPRSTVFYKFLGSCVTFHVEEAYPFYHMDRQNFLEFSAQVIDYTITLLLW